MKPCAIFDLDKTIIDLSSEKRFIRYLLSKRAMTTFDLLAWVWQIFRTFPNDAINTWRTNKRYLKGKDHYQIEGLAYRFFSEVLENHISKKAIAKIEEHKNLGHKVVLLSATLEILLRPFKDRLGPDYIVGAKLQTENGIITGRIEGLYPFGINKALIAKRLAGSYGFDLGNSYAYGDHFGDIGLLKIVGNAVAVDPDRKLTKAGKKEGWRMENWKGGNSVA